MAALTKVEHRFGAIAHVAAIFLRRAGKRLCGGVLRSKKHAQDQDDDAKHAQFIHCRTGKSKNSPMKIADIDLLLVPGYKNSGPDHWMSRWERQFKSARRVRQDDWHKPVVEEWTTSFINEMNKSQLPIVCAAHSLGCHVVLQALPQLDEAQRARIRGALFVAPPEVENPAIRPRHLMTFGPYPRDPLPFPSVVIASASDPFCSLDAAGDMANAWGSLFMEVGDAGHLDEASGHGPWPEGLLVFGEFMKGL